MYETRLGEGRNRRTNPYRRLLDLGFHVPFGSDGMPFHPLYGIWSAVNHPIPGSRISVEEAVRCYTLEGAYATQEEDIKGSIEPGKLADVTILPMDVTKPGFHLAKTDAGSVERAKREMKKTKAYTTILNGDIVFQA
jgi:predicted amidohydrolase YtcJ